MKKLFWLLVISSLPALATPVFQSMPSFLYMYEDRDVLFTLAWEFPDPAKHPVLVECKPETGEILFAWPMNDEGTFGDEKSHDGLYSRTVQFKEKTPETLSFGVIIADKTQNDVPSLQGQPVTHKLILDVKRRPTFIQLIQEVIRRIREK